jgi:hypothetical protein
MNEMMDRFVPASLRPLATPLVTGVVLASLLCIGCEKETVRSEDAKKSDPPARKSDPAARVSVSAPATAHGSAADAEAGPIPWLVPSNWERVPGEKAMRMATFRRPNVPNEEIVVSQFAGTVGGVLANVNRWRQQVGLPAITEAELATETRPFDNGKMKGHTMRLHGEKQHMLAAIISDPENDRTWFVKAMTTPTGADALEGDVFAFARSFGTGKAMNESKTSATQPTTAGSQK